MDCAKQHNWLNKALRAACFRQPAKNANRFIFKAGEIDSATFALVKNNLKVKLIEKLIKIRYLVQ